MELVDAGFNFTHPAFREDETEVIERARQAGVKHFILTGSNVEDSNHALQLSTRYTDMYATAGIHPHLAREWTDETSLQLRELAEHENVVAIGEAGLDFNRNYSTPAEQKTAFQAQLELAAELSMPIFLHMRDAHRDFVRLLVQYRTRLNKVVVHCFTGTATELDCYLDLDCHIGITGWICDARRGRHLHEIISRIPKNRLMIETDAPYLLPKDVPIGADCLSTTRRLSRPKNRRNEPCYLVHILETVAKCRGVPARQLAMETTQTALEFFSIA